jgi:hypothetical protein
MRIYYLNAIQDAPDRHKIIATASNGDAFDTSTLALSHSVAYIDEIQANLPQMGALLRSLQGPPNPGGPPIVPWQFVDGGRFRRSDGTEWTPVVNADRADAVDNTVYVAAQTQLQDIVDTVEGGGVNLAQVKTAVKRMAVIEKKLLRTLVRYLRKE